MSVMIVGYVDFLKRLGRKDYHDRPFCDLCGPFRGRRLRKIPPITNYDPPDGNWRCQGCDEE